MAQTARKREEYTHPEKIYKNLLEYPFTGIVTSEVKERFQAPQFPVIDLQGDLKEQELCWSCGWSVHDQRFSSYGSRVRIFHTRGNVGIWEVGSRWMIRDQPNDISLGNDFITQEFLRHHKPSLNIPLLEHMQKLSAPTDKVDLTLMSRAQGVGLDTIWDTLTTEQKSNYTPQLGTAIKEWRQFTSLEAKNVNGGLMEDCIIGNCIRRTAPTGKKMGRTTDEWFSNLEVDLRIGLSLMHKTKDPLIIDQKFQELRKNFPKSEPYFISHGDLNFTNIIVKDDRIEAIIDWEYSGYMHWWAERWLSLIGGWGNSDELFGPLWADVGVEMDEATFQMEVIDKVADVLDAWGRCSLSATHPGFEKGWLRPGFCKCRPIAGSFRWNQIGNQPEHRLPDDGVVESSLC